MPPVTSWDRSPGSVALGREAVTRDVTLGRLWRSGRGSGMHGSLFSQLSAPSASVPEMEPGQVI